MYDSKPSVTIGEGEGEDGIKEEEFLGEFQCFSHKENVFMVVHFYSRGRGRGIRPGRGGGRGIRPGRGGGRGIRPGRGGGRSISSPGIGGMQIAFMQPVEVSDFPHVYKENVASVFFL